VARRRQTNRGQKYVRQEGLVMPARIEGMKKGVRNKKEDSPGVKRKSKLGWHQIIHLVIDEIIVFEYQRMRPER
jgi:hypothetical protein